MPDLLQGCDSGREAGVGVGTGPGLGTGPGGVRSAPLAIFARFSEPDGFNQAIALSVILIFVSVALLAAVKLTGGDRAMEGRGL